MNGYYLYILRSEKDGTYYLGQTNNIEERLKRHNNGLVKSTKNRIPFTVIYTEKYSSRREAMLREKFLKSNKGFRDKKAIIANILQGL